MPSIDKIFDTHTELNHCTGCGACQNVCPYSAIEMRADAIEGYKPFIIKNKCTDCGKCVAVCPSLNDDENVYFPIEGYAAVATDDIRMNSSSGSFFSVAAAEVLSHGGVVYDESFPQ